MKKAISLMLTVLLLSTALLGCAGGKSKAPSTAPPTAPEAGNAPAEGQEANGKTDAPSVILLIPGSLGDKSFFDSAHNGMKMIEETYGCKTKTIEMSADISKFVPTFEDVIADGWDIIVTGGINVSDPMQEVAEKYPDQKFVLFDETVDYTGGNNQNVYTMTYKCYEGSYLAGAMAGLVTKSGMPGANPENIIGFAGGFDIPLINDWLVGYIAGAQQVNPEVKVGVGYMSSFTDAPKGKEVGLGLINSGADVIMQAAGGAGLGVLDAAAEKSVYAVGTDSDQAALFSDNEAKANAILVSVLKRVDVSIEKMIGKYIDGTLAFGTTDTYGISEGCIELTDNEWYNKNVPEEIRAEVATLAQKIQAGEITVKSAFEMTDDEVAELKASVKP